MSYRLSALSVILLLFFTSAGAVDPPGTAYCTVQGIGSLQLEPPAKLMLYCEDEAGLGASHETTLSPSELWNMLLLFRAMQEGRTTPVITWPLWWSKPPDGG